MNKITDTQRLNWLEKQVVNVRENLRYGSYDLFWSTPDLEEGVSDLRDMIDKYIRANK